MDSNDVEKLSDAIGSIAVSLKWLGNADAATPMGAIEGHGLTIQEAGEKIAESLDDIGLAIHALADAINNFKKANE